MCVCVCVYIYIYICIDTHTHTYIYTYVCIYIYTHRHIHIYIYMKWNGSIEYANALGREGEMKGNGIKGNFKWGSSIVSVTLYLFKNDLSRASLVAQWLTIFLPMQGTRVWALVREDPTCRGATKSVRHNYQAHVPQVLKPAHLELHALQQEKSLQWEASAPQRRVAPARRN